MVSHLTSFLTPPQFTDLEKNRITKMLYTMLLILGATAIVGIIMGLIFNRPPITINVGIAFVIVLACLWLTRRGQVNLAATIISLSLVLIMTTIAFSGLGIHAHSILMFTFILVMASLILQERIFIIITILCVLAAGFLTAAEMNGMIATPMSAIVSLYDFFGVSIIFVLTAVFTRLAANNLKQSLQRTQQNERSLSDANQKLIQRETETHQFLQNLQALYEINLDLSRIESLSTMYQRAVELGRSQLGFDRLAILLYDPETNEMIGTYGTNEQGQSIDESHYRGPAFPYMLDMLNKKPKVFVRQNEPLHFAGKEVGIGWNALTILWDGDKGVGWLTTDNLVQQQPVLPYQLEILTLYGSTLGHLITLKRQKEIVNTYAHELEESNQGLEQFAYAASHDLQEPLRKIQTYSDRLTTKYAESLDERGLNYLARMQVAADRMQKLIQNLLELSRVTRQTDPLTAVNLTAVLQDVLEDLETRIDEKQVIIEADSLPTIQADPTQMGQLLQNLLGNAMKFSRPQIQPHIAIRCKIDAQNERITLTVQDNGIGFDEAFSERIFAPFQRLHTRDEYEGSGIGLALCKRIVERHNGRITAHSIPDQGATFTITLPIKQE